MECKKWILVFMPSKKKKKILLLESRGKQTKKKQHSQKINKGLDFQLTHAGFHITGLQTRREKHLYSNLWTVFWLENNSLYLMGQKHRRESKTFLITAKKSSYQITAPLTTPQQGPEYLSMYVLYSWFAKGHFCAVC